MEVRDGKYEVRNSGGIADAFYFYVSLDWFYHCFTVQVTGFDSELVIRKFPKIKTQTDYYRQLRMDAGKIAGNNGIKSTNYGKFAGIFLGKIAKGKKFYLHGSTSRSSFQNTLYYHLIIAIMSKNG